MNVKITTPHSPEEARALRATARGMFATDHGHNGYNDDLTRSSCGECALIGYGESTDDGAAELQPNYAGWARLYIQAGRAIPERWRAAFEDERVSDNHAYAAGLAADVETWGVTFTA